MAYRYVKSELALESPRLWFWHNRLKLLLMTTLVYAFLLSLLEPDLEPLRSCAISVTVQTNGAKLP